MKNLDATISQEELEEEFSKTDEDGVRVRGLNYWLEWQNLEA
jgi:hypothetical protein